MLLGHCSGRSVGKWFTVLYLYQSVCQSSTLLQHNEEEEQEDEKEMKKVKDSRRTRKGIKHHKPNGKPRENLINVIKKNRKERR